MGIVKFYNIAYFRSSQSSTGVRLTGDPQADADIMAFVKARQNILQQSKLLHILSQNIEFISYIYILL